MPAISVLHSFFNSDLKRQSIRYLLATVLSAGLSISIPVFFHEFMEIPEELSVALSLTIVFIVNFFTLRYFVFQSSGERLPQFFKLALTSIVFRVAEYLIFLLIFKMLSINYIAALIVALAVSFVSKFFVQRFYVFNR